MISNSIVSCFLQIVFSTFSILGATYLLNAANGKNTFRIQQFALIPTSFLMMCTEIGGYMVFFDFIRMLNLRFPSFLNKYLFAVNLFLITSYTVVKKGYTFLTNKYFTNEHLLKIFAFIFYEWSPLERKWFLKEEWQGYRKLLFWLILSLCLITGVYLGLTLYYGPYSSIWFHVFPAAAIVVLSECYGYLNGETKTEYEQRTREINEDGEVLSDYPLVYEALKRVLPQPMLNNYLGRDYEKRKTAQDLIESLSKSKDKTDQLIAEYFRSNFNLENLEIDNIQAVRDLMNGKNTVFFNPFYKDSGPYIVLPIIQTLLEGKKVLIVVGRNSNCKQIEDWIETEITNYIHVKNLWKIGIIDEKLEDLDIAILSFNQLYNYKILQSSLEFLKEVKFVLLIEPSTLLSTGQIAFNLIAQEMNRYTSDVTYCVLDRQTSGLVDTLSHLINQEITEVVALPVPRGKFFTMQWNVDDNFRNKDLLEGQIGYLGNGTELAANAIKNGINQVSWYGQSKLPLRDVRWIAGQYYADLCQYMDLPIHQQSIYDHIEFEPTLWNSTRKSERFMIVEDEFCNSFAMMRMYMSRGKKQVFLNLLSENYLLRDYMSHNQDLFFKDPAAIPSIVPDYAKTERNTILKLLLLMALKPVSEKQIREEFLLIDLKTEDVYSTLLDLIAKYTYAQPDVLSISYKNGVEGNSLSVNKETIFKVPLQKYDQYFKDTLKSAYFIIEDEQGEKELVDTKLYNHVSQITLPGQFITYDGKYYQTKSIDPEKGVVLRRASALYDSRKYYRQARNYKWDGTVNELLKSRHSQEFDLEEISINFSVDTYGYLVGNDSSNLKDTKFIDFRNEPTSSIFSRQYHNKSILRLRFTDMNSTISRTVALLLSEIFKTLFPDTHSYLAVLIARNDSTQKEDFLLYQATGGFESNTIYIVEDSDLDLGLLSAIEKNFDRIMEILTDYLDWYMNGLNNGFTVEPEEGETEVE